MKQFYLYLIIFLITGMKLLASENIIENIIIEGNLRIDSETVISYSNVSKGDIYEEELYDENIDSDNEYDYLDYY